MSVFKPEYETYQDVKSTLACWSVPVWAALMYCLFYVVLLDAHRTAILSLIPGLAAWTALVGSVVVLFVLAGVVSHTAVHIFEIHDHIYDRYIIRWRERYARERMIPKLLEPYRVLLGDDLVAAALRQQGDTLKSLFYPFAGDRDSRIRRNLVARFYERITKYWLTQVVEIAALLLVSCTVIYAGFFYSKPYPTRTGWMLVAVVVAVLINRLAIWGLRKSVWEATEDEIADIHRSCKSDFGKALEHLKPRLRTADAHREPPA